MVCLYFWQDDPVRTPYRNISQPIAAPCHQIHQALKSSDEVNQITAEVLPDLTGTLVPISSPEHYQHPSTQEFRAPRQLSQARAVTPQPAETLLFTDVACSNLGGL